MPWYGFSKEVLEFPSALITGHQLFGFVAFGFSLCNGSFRVRSVEKSQNLFLQGIMGFVKDPLAFLHVLQTVLEMTSYRIILFTAGYEPFNAAIQVIAAEHVDSIQFSEDCISLINGRLFCFSGIYFGIVCITLSSSTIAYNWLFPQCAAVIHHGGSGSTAAALQAGIPQVLCPFMHDQFYWAERMHWLGVAPEPLRRNDLFPEANDKKSIRAAAYVLSRAINDAFSPEVKARAAEISEKLSAEDGVLEAVECIKKELGCLNSDTLAS
ncbi:hypothetical protein TIFTF001_027981 [Ficus carica]|uniref:Erythromycin biosynthesis protein CIII-like C-terminal domain-containing protein n=1 Tax=Ficus carica TaxID=3494 RepID=A0AA88DPF2_FICCA|nr:hypothetical protein TIFTF001_027981 [Ficus carica]